MPTGQSLRSRATLAPNGPDSRAGGGDAMHVLVADDGALLVSDDFNGAVYRVAYGG